MPSRKPQTCNGPQLFLLHAVHGFGFGTDYRLHQVISVDEQPFTRSTQIVQLTRAVPGLEVSSARNLS